ncbi:glycosyltransferase [Devosia nitrariae]|uniref:Glycosyl transferase n=1 Tax=Devosia nitrariae TaxID=2071872 RepID=A0ABQ5WEC3_9HYPH|nr:glycosyltransferase [Devosia nitrariae]GLQ57931.1 glycosyl transferase [Devosia nitrariae]
MKKVAFVINSLAGGGAERIMARLLTRLAKTQPEIELHLVLLDIEPEAYQVPPEVIVHQLDTGGSLSRGFRPFKEKLEQIRPSTCVSFLTRANILSIAACRLLGVRCVISERVNTSSHHAKNISGNVARIATYLSYRHADQVIAVSSGIAKDLSENYGVPKSKITVISNPIDAEMIRTLGALPMEMNYARPLIVGMGRLVPNKNFAMLLEAFALSGATGTLLIMGEGPLQDELMDHADKLGISDRVVFAGFRENPFSVIAAADCYVLSSNGEGFPNGLVEAMCLGTPIVSTNCHSGPAEILDDRPYFDISDVTECQFGILVPVNDAKSMSKAISATVLPSQRAERGARALAGASRFGLDSTIAKYWQAITGA